MLVLEFSGKETIKLSVQSVQFSPQSCPTLCDPMNRSTPGLPVHHLLPQFTQTHVHRVHDAIQPSHPQSSPSPPAPNTSQHQSFSNESTLCSPRDCSPSDSSAHGILQAGTREWLPFPSPGDLPDPGIKPRSSASQADSLPAEPQGKP